ncbi:hypothetical protein LR48_Vigan11g073100 [Vigna angularis]|uniref:Uncharacterized protein n=1 Tax=Phaseolus angularis TaxID=3914 RepID=A0A0L9VRX0_PHAAN|nr:hypothetical protein LR48_Vigan11g073100 [Vigna angularis]
MVSSGVEENSKEEYLNGCFKGCKYEYWKLSLGVHPDILMITYSQVERGWPSCFTTTSARTDIATYSY